MLANPYQQYQESTLETASQGKLLLMLYDGAIRFLTQASAAMEAKNWQDSHNFILKAEDVITELMACLRMEAGGEIAFNLYRLYEYMNWRLIQANIKRDQAMVLEVQQRLRELREAWVEAIKLQGTQASATGAA
ncbi:Flagellar protein FliS [compost metagenome]